MENLQGNNDLDDNHVQKKPKLNKGGPKADEIWKYYNKQKNETSDGHYSAECYSCKKSWSRGEPAKLKAHLANECLKCPEDIRKYWQKKLISEKIDYFQCLTKNNATILGPQLINNHFNFNKPATNEEIDHSLVKAMIMTGMPLRLIESPFMIDFIHELNSEYTPPSYSTLSGQLLDQVISQAELKIEKETDHNIKK
ncbi:hypothetical protein Glove_158g94 [Diversispora epigaea]|uniref:Uncharacterized protein n=1 Tax=Diversispora epigaea TaxID=1348612 RepID=A0A397IWA9_9GLOM|nr:hypothetical protein Glove_158g94 [Diversispora epigaea]